MNLTYGILFDRNEFIVWIIGSKFYFNYFKIFWNFEFDEMHSNTSEVNESYDKLGTNSKVSSILDMLKLNQTTWAFSDALQNSINKFKFIIIYFQLNKSFVKKMLIRFFRKITKQNQQFDFNRLMTSSFSFQGKHEIWKIPLVNNKKIIKM